MTRKRPHLTALTTRLLYVLHEFGPGGASIDLIAAKAELRTRQARARLQWLQRTKLVRYVHDTALWQLTDDSMFSEASR